jgi:hypothetical protein
MPAFDIECSPNQAVDYKRVAGAADSASAYLLGYYEEL